MSKDTMKLLKKRFFREDGNLNELGKKVIQEISNSSEARSTSGPLYRDW